MKLCDRCGKAHETRVPFPIKTERSTMDFYLCPPCYAKVSPTAGPEQKAATAEAGRDE